MESAIFLIFCMWVELDEGCRMPQTRAFQVFLEGKNSIALISKKLLKSSSKTLHILKSFNFVPIVVSEFSTLKICHVQSNLITLSAHNFPPERLGELHIAAFNISHRTLLTCEKSKKSPSPFSTYTSRRYNSFWVSAREKNGRIKNNQCLKL